MHFAELEMNLRLYFKKRKVEAESSASIKEGGDREDICRDTERGSGKR